MCLEKALENDMSLLIGLGFLPISIRGEGRGEEGEDETGGEGRG